MLINRDYISVEEHGAKGNGIKVDSAAIDKALAAAVAGKVKKVKMPDGIFIINKTIDIPRGVHFELSQQTTIKPNAGNFNIFQIRPESRLSGGNVNLESVIFTKAVIYLDAADVFQFYGQSHTVSDMVILNKVPAVFGAFTGTGILCEAKTNMAYIDNVKFNNLTFINFEKVIHLRVDPILDEMFKTDPNVMAWVNANYFFQITAQNFSYGIYMEGLGRVPRDVGGNMFNQCQFQAEPHSKSIVYCEGGYNFFDIFMWDVHKMTNDNPAIQFAKSSKFNKITTAMQLEISESWKDEGYMNQIVSPGNYVPDTRSMAQRVSTPYKGQFNGIQDDYMVFGNHRGYTVTQTKGAAALDDLDLIFSTNNEFGPIFDMTNTDYDNPMEIVIDCSSDPIHYAQYIGTVHPWDSIPEGMLIEGWTGTEWLWLHEIQGNKSLDYIISPPYSGVDFLNKIRISFYGAVSPNKMVTISRVVATSSSKMGKAFIPQFTDKLPMIDANGVTWDIKLNTDGTWTNIAPNTNSITPPIAGEVIMTGNQDDIFLMADKRYSIKNIGIAKNAGELYHPFRLGKDQWYRWGNPTVATPAIIEMDFGTTPIQSMDTIGVSFVWGDVPKNIKIERTTSSAGNYQQVYNTTVNTASNIFIECRSANIYKIKITLSVPVNTVTNNIRLSRIYGTASLTNPKVFVNVEEDNEVYGGIEFKDSLKGLIMTSPDGSRWKSSIDNTGVMIWTKL